MRRMGWPVVLLGAALAACGGADSGGAGSNPVLTIGKTGIANGDNQIGTVASPLTNNLRVVVTDDGDPVEGEVITWAAGSGAVAPLQSTTDQNGVATTLWTLGTTAGLQNVTATLRRRGGLAASASTRSANPGSVAGIAPTAGNGQFAVVSTAFAQSLGAKVSDQFGNGIIGVAVTWTVVSGPVTTTAGTSSSNSQGVATMTVNAAGTIGPAVVSAAAAGLLQTADFDLTVVPAARQVAVGNNFFQSGSQRHHQSRGGHGGGRAAGAVEPRGRNP